MSRETNLKPIIGTDNPKRKADIIFVHGLGGDARGTWHPQERKDDNNFWPMWLGEDFEECGIWSINYQVEPTSWRGHSMPLLKRATNVVDLLDGKDLGKKPIIFITHSMGGLVVKQLLLNATYSREDSWKKIVEQTKGIVYLSTPHSGSKIANWFKYIGGILGANVSISELERNKPDLIDLNAQYCAHERLSKIPVLVYCETKKLKISWRLEAIVVDERSANPNINISGKGIEDIKVIPLDEDHISISKPNSKEHQIYRGVKKFIEKCLFDSNFSNDSNNEQLKRDELSSKLVELLKLSGRTTLLRRETLCQDIGLDMGSMPNAMLLADDDFGKTLITTLFNRKLKESLYNLCDTLEPDFPSEPYHDELIEVRNQLRNYL